MRDSWRGHRVGGARPGGLADRQERLDPFWRDSQCLSSRMASDSALLVQFFDNPVDHDR
jgi:hypothetical protein